MAGRSPSTFAKRQREMDKRAKRQDKELKRAARKAERESGTGDQPAIETPEGAPAGDTSTAAASAEEATGNANG